MKAEKSLYRYRIEPHEVDFTLRATIPALGSVVLNTAGTDAHGKGFGVDALNAGNHSWVLSRIAFEFDRRPKQYDEYTVATWISDYGRVLSTRNFTLSDSSGSEFGRAVSQWAMIDLASRTAVDLSWVGDAHADAIVDAEPPAEKPRKIRAVTPSERCEHRVVYSDIDFNRHVNTMRYIEMMLDMLPLERLTCEAPVRMDIHFMKECRYGQTLAVGAEFRDDEALFEIVNDEGAAAVRAAIGWK
ncbi:MAG: acyl-ACP thioesterase [Alistipes sp.]|nr:acyl-ACP thioesterase [Alistipes sp.]